jgi:hypothetical protein
MSVSVGTQDAAHAIVAAIEAVLKKPPQTSDLAGNSNTAEVGNAIAARIGLTRTKYHDHQPFNKASLFARIILLVACGLRPQVVHSLR